MDPTERPATVLRACLVQLALQTYASKRTWQLAYDREQIFTSVHVDEMPISISHPGPGIYSIQLMSDDTETQVLSGSPLFALLQELHKLILDIYRQELTLDRETDPIFQIINNH